MVRWIFSRQGFLVLVEAEMVIIQSVVSHVSPYLQGQEIGNGLPHDVWTIQAYRMTTASCCAVNNPERLSYQEPFASIHSEKKIIIVEEATEKLVVQRVIRLLRNLFRLLLAPEAIFVHGGMIEIAGKGIAFIGEKYAGKTSSLLATLTQVQTSFIENDSLSLHIDSGPYGLGWFRSIYIRRDILTVLEAVLVKKQLEFLHLEHAKEKPSLSPQAFAATFGCTLLPQAALHMIVFPRFLPREDHPTFSLLPLSKEEAFAMLKKNLVSVPNEYHQFLRPYFPLFPENTHLLEELILQVPCYCLQQSFLAIALAARDVVALAHSAQEDVSMNARTLR